jgi:hypothetical protein
MDKGDMTNNTYDIVSLGLSARKSSGDDLPYMEIRDLTKNIGM